MEWIVSGFILGDVLPLESLRLGSAEIHRRRPGEKGTHFKPTNVSAVLEGSPNFRSVTYGRVEVFSEWIVNFAVNAPSAQEAVEVVDQIHLPPVQAALEVSFDSRYFIDLHRVYAVDRSQPHVSPSVGSGPVDSIEPFEMDEEDRDQVAATYDLLVKDGTALEAAHLLVNSALVRDVSDEGRIQRFVLLNLFQAIENVVNEVAKEAPLDPGDDVKREAVLDDLYRALKAPSSTRKRVARVRSAVTDLNRLEKTFLTPRIEAAARVLNLPEEISRETIEFLKLRNTKLGHTGQALDREELARWLEDGRRLVIECLDAFIEWRRS